jgi:hypothetical protein
MQLLDFAEDYAIRHALSDDCARNYLKNLHNLCGFAGSDLTLADLKTLVADRWLASKIANGRSPHYVSSLRSCVVAIWNDAFKLQIISQAPVVMRIRRPDQIIRTWTPADVAMLIADARQLPGMFRKLNIPRGPYIASAIGGVWYGGVRRRDLHKIRYDQIADDGSFAILQNKTSKCHIGRIPADILLEIRQWTSPPGPVWPRPGCDEVIRRLFRELVDSLAARHPALLRGRWRDIRRSAENSAEDRHPGRGHLLGGHQRRVFEAYYKRTETTPSVAPEPLPIS